MRTIKRSEFAITLKDGIYLAALLITIGIQWAQVGNLRSELSSLEDRYKNEVVPRSEHLQMNNVTEERWRAVGERLSHMESQLNDVQKQLSERRNGN